MRTFIAVNPDENMKKALLHVQERLKQNNIHGNYTKPENLHLTLAFIGEYPDPDNILDTLARVRFRPFELRLAGIGSFGRILWVGTTAKTELEGCALQIRHYLSEADIPFDRKKFSPHITILREPDKQALPDIVIQGAAMTVREIFSP